tara:strand:- start:1072 stop:1521 length:450 start_codon:yes stop_codon:yes gene_type:complete
MKKIFILISSLLMLSNCGYEPVYSSKNINFTVGNIEKTNNNLNNEFVRAIKSLSYQETENKIDIKIESNKEIFTKSKDAKGNPLIYELQITLKVKIQNNIENQERILIQKISYKNIEDKFELKQYEAELQKMLVAKLVEDMIKYLTNYQ